MCRAVIALILTLSFVAVQAAPPRAVLSVEVNGALDNRAVIDAILESDSVLDALEMTAEKPDHIGGNGAVCPDLVHEAVYVVTCPVSESGGFPDMRACTETTVTMQRQNGWQVDPHSGRIEPRCEAVGSVVSSDCDTICY
ncbi:MAG: hypothetical protein AAF493_09195 [Pseudomonadota bacterium]